ncbi:MAG: DUF4440 domain-containing protein [Microthrixaceae bacterium]
MDELGELLKLEHAGWTSLCDGTASDFYGSIMAEHARMILANGTVMNRSEVIDSLSHAPPWGGYAIDDPSVVPISPDASALLYTGTGHRDGGPDFTGVMTSVYVRQGSERRLALYQQTVTS